MTPWIDFFLQAFVETLAAICAGLFVLGVVFACAFVALKVIGAMPRRRARR